jgi:adenylosuccinate synthase
MACTVVVGGQYGSEGKGKVVSLMSLDAATPWVIRCGGPNSGHTTVVAGRDIVLRQVPAGVSNPNAKLAIAAGCVVDEALLLKEVDLLGLEPDRLIVDPRAVLIEPQDRDAECDSAMRIGSTASGTGAALIRRMSRSPGVRLVAQSEMLRGRVRIEQVAPLLHDAHLAGEDIIVEGTQGFGLSLFHGAQYPYVTARDTTASAFASEVGLSPRYVDRVCVVIRTFPIRVGGNSGPFPGEIDWQEVRRLSGAPATIPELTSVTKRTRRVACFDMSMVVAACRYNGATELAVMGLDRLDYRDTGVKQTSDLSLSARRFLKSLNQATSVPIGWVGTDFPTRGAFRFTSKDSRLDRELAM